MHQHFEQFVGKQRRLEGKYLGISEAEPLRFDCVNQFSLEELCRTQYSLKYFLKPYQPLDRLLKKTLINNFFWGYFRITVQCSLYCVWLRINDRGSIS